MSRSTSEGRVKKLLLMWPAPIPDRIRALFADVFVNISELIQYVSRDITKTDVFHLIIPFDCFEQLRNDPVYDFPQVEDIKVFCDSISDLNWIKHRFTCINDKVQFCTIHSLCEPWTAALLGSSGPIDRSLINDIISLEAARLRAKKLAVFARLFPVHHQCASTFLHGLPVKNVHDYIPYLACPSCQLVYQQPYQLECKHHQCGGCINIQKSCARCFTAVSPDKVLSDPNLQTQIQNLSADCYGCAWTGLFKNYQDHFMRNHPGLIPCFIQNQQADESISHEEIHLDNTSLNGACVWEISNVNDLKIDAVSGKQNSIYSCPFYLFPNGYKICLRLFVNGDLKAKNTHMSLFFVIMRGDYDHNLQWPFKFKVTFSLIDQSTMNDNDHINQFCWPDATPICFECPQFSMNLPYGISECFPLDIFEQDRFVQNDTMFIKVQFNISAEKPTLPLEVGLGELPTEEVRVNTTDGNISHMIGV